MANLGPIPVPDKFAPALKYIKFVIAVLGVIATVVVAVVPPAAVPAYVYLVISAATALGVYMAPNKDVSAILQEGTVAVTGFEKAYTDAKAGKTVDAVLEGQKAAEAAREAAKRSEDVANALMADTWDPRKRPMLPSERPMPPQPIKGATLPTEPVPPASEPSGTTPEVPPESQEPENPPTPPVPEVPRSNEPPLTH